MDCTACYRPIICWLALWVHVYFHSVIKCVKQCCCMLILLPKSTFNANLTTTNRFFTNDDWQRGRFEYFESDHQYESNLESDVRFEIELNHEASQVPSRLWLSVIGRYFPLCCTWSRNKFYGNAVDWVKFISFLCKQWQPAWFSEVCNWCGWLLPDFLQGVHQHAVDHLFLLPRHLRTCSHNQASICCYHSLYWKL